MKNKIDYLVGKIKYGTKSSGSCNIIQTTDQKYIFMLTAFHIFDEDKLDSNKIIVTREINGVCESFDFKLLGYVFDKESDIAILRIETKEPAIPVSISSDQEDMGMLQVFGFPNALEDSDIIKKFCLEGTIKSCLQTKLIIGINTPLQTYQSSENSNMIGFSGGGLYFYYDNNPVLVGIETRLLSAEGVYQAVTCVPITEIIKFIVDSSDFLNIDYKELKFRNLDYELINIRNNPIYYKNLIFINELHKNLSADKLQSEYRAGINAHPDHIRYEIDIEREIWLDKIEQCFKTNNVLIIRGASGQGKTSLSYRYLLNNYDEQRILCVKGNNIDKTSLEIIKLIRQLEQKYPLIIYMDVEPGNENWTELVGRWIECGISSKLLISIREEDYNRSNIPYYGNFAELELVLSQEEAQMLFSNYEAKEFSSFEESWIMFGNKGPLMEYVYLLNHSQNLKERLKSQIYNIEKKGYDEQWIELLAIISFAGKYNCSVPIQRLFEKVKCRNQRTIIRSLEKELFIKTTENGQYLETLHVLRSSLIFEVLEEEFFIDIKDILLKTCAVVDDNLLYAIIDYFIHCSSVTSFIEELGKVHIAGITTFANIVKAILWYEVYYFKKINSEVIIEGNKIFNNSFGAIAKPDITGLLDADNIGSDIFEIFDQIYPGTKDKYVSLIEKFPMQTLSYCFVDKFLSLTIGHLHSFIKWDETDYTSLGYVLYWAAKRNLFIDENTIDISTIYCLQIDKVEECLNLMIGIWEQKWYSIFKKIKKLVRSAVFEEYNLISYRRIDKQIFTEFIEDFDENLKLPAWSFNDKCMRVEYAFRRYDPDAEVYHTKLVGTEILGITVPDTEKHIECKKMYSSWITQLNAVFRRLNEYDVAPESWENIINNICEVREACVKFIGKLLEFIEKWYANKNFKNVNDLKLLWKKALQKTSVNAFSIPKSSLDPYGIVTNYRGFASEITNSFSNIEGIFRNNEESDIEGNFQKICHEYFSNMNVFFESIFTLIEESKNKSIRSDISRRVYYAIAKARFVLPELHEYMPVFFSNYEIRFDNEKELSLVESIAIESQHLFLNNQHQNNTFHYIARENIKTRRRKIDGFISDGIKCIQNVENFRYENHIVYITVSVDHEESVVEQIYKEIVELTDLMNSISLDGYYLQKKMKHISVDLILDGKIIVKDKKYKSKSFLVANSIQDIMINASVSGVTTYNGDISSIKDAIVSLILCENNYDIINRLANSVRESIQHSKSEYTMPGKDKFNKQMLGYIKKLNEETEHILGYILENCVEAKESIEQIIIAIQEVLNIMGKRSIYSYDNTCLCDEKIKELEYLREKLIYVLQEYEYI